MGRGLVRIYKRWLLGIVLIGMIVLGWGGFSRNPAWADPPEEPRLVTIAQTSLSSISDPGKATISSNDQIELERLRTEQQLRRLIESSLITSATLRDRIELEVDRSFDHLTTILNTLITVLTAVPILLALGVWLLRRSVISELVSQVKGQVEKEITSEVKRQRDLSVQQIEALKQSALEQLNRMVTDTQATLDELGQQTTSAKQEIEGMTSQAAQQLQEMLADAQAMKDSTIQELAKLLPASTQDPLPPEVQPKIGRLMAILDSLKSVIPQLTYSAGDYVKQGNAFFFEGRYEEADQCYDRAIQLNADSYEAWFSKASVCLISQHYEEAMDAYDRALALKPDSYEAHFGQASVFRKLQNWEAAITAYDRAIQLRPDQAKPWYNRAGCYVLLNQPEATFESLEQAIQLAPDKYRETAKTDPLFEPLRGDDRFLRLVNPASEATNDLA